MRESSSPICNNPAIQELVKSMESTEALSLVFSVSTEFGITAEELGQVLEKCCVLSEKAREIINIPDRFNKHFAGRGWIAYGMLDIDLAKEVIGLADNGRIDNAERLLINYYDETLLNSIIQRCNINDKNRSRWELAQKAKAEYLEGRYYCAIPLILMLIDGFVNDIRGTGFFTPRTDLSALDSIAGHSSGLAKLSELFGSDRTKTTTEALTIPYRHGILHGRDLGYANQMVAAKAWACLAAIADWASDLRGGRKQPQVQATPPSLDDILKRIQEIEQCNKNNALWKPRRNIVGRTIPETGEPDDYKNGSPEHALANLFCWWKAKNYGHMASLLSDSLDGVVSPKNAGEISKDFGLVAFSGFKLLEINDDAPANTTIRVVVNYSKNGKQKESKLELRLFYQNGNGNPRSYPLEQGSWVVLKQGFNEVLFSWL